MNTKFKMRLNEKKLEFIKAITEKYGEQDIIGRDKINEIRDINKDLKWPSWLTASKQLRAGRGQFYLPNIDGEVGISKPEVKVIDVTDESGINESLGTNGKKIEGNWWGEGAAPKKKFKLPENKVNTDICECPKCSQPGYVMYHGHLVCNNHWVRHCKDENDYSLKKVFCIYS